MCEVLISLLDVSKDASWPDRGAELLLSKLEATRQLVHAG